MKAIMTYAVVFVSILLVQKAASVPAAPLDINENVHHTLETVSSLVGIVGGGASTLIMQLTGVSITDCALQIQGVDTSLMTCQEFLDLLGTCDSLANVKPLLKAAKKKYLKSYPKRAAKPCANQ